MIAILAIGFCSQAQDKTSVGVFKGSNNTYGMEFTSNNSPKKNSYVYGVGFSHQVATDFNSNIGVFGIIGYQKGLFIFKTRFGGGTIENNAKVLVGATTGIKLAKNLAAHIGYDTMNNYTTGISLTLK